MLVMQLMAAVSRSILGSPVATLIGEADEISGSLDMLLIGLRAGRDGQPLQTGLFGQSCSLCLT